MKKSPNLNLKYLIQAFIFFILGEDYIVEAAPSDKIWGVGMDKTNENISIPSLWKGTNILGWALMEARDKFETTGNKCQT